jgi:hypothetical protein
MGGRSLDSRIWVALNTFHAEAHVDIRLLRSSTAQGVQREGGMIGSDFNNLR